MDWDYGASGIWNVRCPGVGGVSGRWHDLLSEGLLAALEVWNMAGELGDRQRARGEPFPDFFYAAAKWLAERVQEELGQEWEVLWVERGAWHWVEAPVGWHSFDSSGGPTTLPDEGDTS